MPIFNNKMRSGYEEVASYGPRFYTKVKEMDAIYRFAGYTLDLMAADLEKLVWNQFIWYMDEEMISKMEAFAEILGTKDMTLDERKRNLLVRLNGFGKLSGSKLEKYLEMIIGEDAEVNVIMRDILEIEIEAKDKSDALYEKMFEFLDKVKPAHISYALIYNSPYIAKYFCGIIWQHDEILEIRQVVI